MSGFAGNHAFGIYRGTTLASPNPLVETRNCTVDFNVDAGIVYRIGVSGNFGGEGNFTLGIVEAPQPANDDVADAQPLGPGLPLRVHGDNQFATREGAEGSLVLSGFTGTNHSVWYQWTAPATERVKLNSCSPGREPLLGVFTGGTTISSLVVATEKQSPVPYCAVELSAIAGTTYKIGIAAIGGSETRGPFDLEIHRVSRPANDDLAGAIDLGASLPVAVDGDNTDATVETEEPGLGETTEPIATVWYRWRSPLSGPVAFGTCGSATNDVVAVQLGGAFATMTRVKPGEEEEPGGCPNDEPGSRDVFKAVAGTTYLLQVSSVSRGFEGPFRLALADPNAKPAPPGAGFVAPVATPPKVLTLKDAIASCRTRFKGKGKKARAKRAACIRKAHLRFALGHCRTLAKSKQPACKARAKRRWAAPPRKRAR